MRLNLASSNENRNSPSFTTGQLGYSANWGDHARPLPFREKTLPQKAFRHFVLKLLLLINAEPIVDKLPCWTFKPSKHQM